MCERWVGDQTELQHIDPHSSGYHSPFSWAAQPGAWGPSSLLRAGFHSSIWNTDFKLWTPTDLNFLSPGLYNNFDAHLLPASVTISHSIQPLDSQGHPWSPDIFDRMHLLFTQVHFDSLAVLEVNMQHHQFWCLYHVDVIVGMHKHWISGISQVVQWGSLKHRGAYLCDRWWQSFHPQGSQDCLRDMFWAQLTLHIS